MKVGYPKGTRLRIIGHSFEDPTRIEYDFTGIVSTGRNADSFDIVSIQHNIGITDILPNHARFIQDGQHAIEQGRDEVIVLSAPIDTEFPDELFDI